MDILLSKFRQWLSLRLPARVMRMVRPFLTVQFVTFMAMGILNTVISITVATLLDMATAAAFKPQNPYRLFAHNTNLNFIIGYSVSIVTSFFLNCRFTFHQKPTIKKFTKFPISYIPNFLCQYIFVLLFTLMAWNKTLAYICAAIIGTPITFAAMKLMVFRRIKQTREEG